MTGFHTLVREGIELNTNQAATLDLALQIGTQAETITVGAEAPLLEAEKADRGSVVLTRNLAELPIITRTPILLATLSPGVTPTNPRYDLTPFSNSGLTTWSINGSTSLSTEFLLDGAPNSAVYQSQPSVAYIPPLDAVQELKVTAGAYDAQYGHNGGGVINMAIKSGTNRLHGSGYDFIKRPRLTPTRSPITRKGCGATTTRSTSTASRSEARSNPEGVQRQGQDLLLRVLGTLQAGHSFPAERHFFGAHDRAAERGFLADLSAAGQLMPVYDPSGRPSTAIGCAIVSRQHHPGIRFDPSGAKIAVYTRSRTRPRRARCRGRTTSSCRTTSPGTTSITSGTRLDHNFGPKERIYGRYVWNNQVLHQVTNGIPGYAPTCAKATRSTTARLRLPDHHQLPAPPSTSAPPSPAGCRTTSPPTGATTTPPSSAGRRDLVNHLPEPNRFPAYQHATATRRSALRPITSGWPPPPPSPSHLR